MAVLPLLYFGNPTLKKKSKEIRDTPPLQVLIDDMFQTMYHFRGAGLAAVQVDRLIRLFIINVDRDPETKTPGTEEVFINPKILNIYGRQEEYEEGCLCVPEIREKVKRKTVVDVEYLDRSGVKRSETGVTGLRARVIQHEYDHLDGMLFIERLSMTRRLLIKKELNRISREYS